MWRIECSCPKTEQDQGVTPSTPTRHCTGSSSQSNRKKKKGTWIGNGGMKRFTCRQHDHLCKIPNRICKNTLRLTLEQWGLRGADPTPLQSGKFVYVCGSKSTDSINHRLNIIYLMKKDLHISGPMQFRPMLFTGQL